MFNAAVETAYTHTQVTEVIATAVTDPQTLG